MRPFSVSVRRFLVQWLVVCLALAPFQARAGLVGTHEASDATAARTAIVAFAARADVSRHLQSLGIDPQRAGERVAALTDAEAAQLAARIDQLPAGAGFETVFVIVMLGFIAWMLVK